MRMIMRVKPGGTERAGAAAGASNRGQKLHEHALRPFAFRVQRTQRSSIPITYRDPEPLTSTRCIANGFCGRQTVRRVCKRLTQGGGGPFATPLS